MCERAGPALSLMDIEKDQTEPNRQLSEPTQKDLESALWDVLTENCDPARWQLNGTEAKSAISDLCRPRWPRLLSVPETWIPRMIAERLEAHGFRVPWRQTHGPGDLGRQGGGTQLLDILRAWERDGRVESVTGADAEHEDIGGRVVRGETAWRLKDGGTPLGGVACEWKPSPGFVGVKTIGMAERFRKNGENPPRTTIDVWISRAENQGTAVTKEYAPDSNEVHLPEAWVLEQIKQWNPRT